MVTFSILTTEELWRIGWSSFMLYRPWNIGTIRNLESCFLCKTQWIIKWTNQTNSVCYWCMGTSYRQVHLGWISGKLDDVRKQHRRKKTRIEMKYERIFIPLYSYLIKCLNIMLREDCKKYIMNVQVFSLEENKQVGCFVFKEIACTIRSVFAWNIYNNVCCTI